jgi:LacI family transcriptional regulator
VTQKKPLVLMDRYFPELSIDYTGVDNLNGARKGMEHLLAKGYKNIAFVTVDLDQIQMLQRKAGYVEALKARGIKVKKENILKLTYALKAEEAIKKITAFIEGLPGIDALFFATNYLGIYGLQSLHDLKKLIPKDIGVVCFDDHDIFKLHTPAISVISQPVEEIATTAIGLLINQLEHKEENPKKSQVCICTSLFIERSST